MKLKRFLNKEEIKILTNLSKKVELISAKAYTTVDRNKDTEKINNILRDIIDGFGSFSCFVNSKQLRIQYNWNWDNNNCPSWYGVGYISIFELKEGFKN